MVTITGERKQSCFLYKGRQTYCPQTTHRPRPLLWNLGTGLSGPFPLWEIGQPWTSHKGAKHHRQAHWNLATASSPGREGQEFQHIPGYLTPSDARLSEA